MPTSKVSFPKRAGTLLSIRPSPTLLWRSGQELIGLAQLVSCPCEYAFVALAAG
jgi:hypothetical protein